MCRVRAKSLAKATVSTTRLPKSSVAVACWLGGSSSEGTRFVQVWSGPQGAKNNWDNHGSISKELPPMAASVDQPIAALLGDLKALGLLEDTLLIWTTEFGRTTVCPGR